MIKSSLASIIFLTLISCTKNNIERSVPDCIKNKIVDFNKNPICDDISVDEYMFQNETVFVFNTGSCGADLQSSVLGASCKTLGVLGGIAGVVEINGEKFSNAIYVQRVWEK